MKKLCSQFAKITLKESERPKENKKNLKKMKNEINFLKRDMIDIEITDGKITVVFIFNRTTCQN